MIDNDMTNILRNFAGAGTGEVTDAKTGTAKVNPATQEKNAMKSLLEGLDAQQKSVNQMPGTHKMAKNGAKHPADKFLVGGRFDPEVELDDEGEVTDFYNGQQVELKPEYADNPGEVFTLSQWDGNRGWVEDEQGRGWGVTSSQITAADEEHEMTENWESEWDATAPDDDNSKFAPGTSVHVGHMTPHGSGIAGKVVKVDGDVIYIKNAEGETYKGQLKNTTVNEADTNEDTIAKRNTGSDVHEKQSFKDIFRSMDETEDDMATRFKKELHDAKSKKALDKGDNGKFDLAEAEMGKTRASFDSMARDMVRLMNKGKTVTVTSSRAGGIGRMEGMVVDFKLTSADTVNESEEELSWGDELLEDLKLLVQEASEYDGIIDTQSVIEIIQKYEV